jgi:hypothetical protein
MEVGEERSTGQPWRLVLKRLVRSRITSALAVCVDVSVIGLLIASADDEHVRIAAAGGPLLVAFVVIQPFVGFVVGRVRVLWLAVLPIVAGQWVDLGCDTSCTAAGLGMVASIIVIPLLYLGVLARRVTLERDDVTDRSVATSATDSQSVLAQLEAADRILVQQVFKAVANEYRISIPPPGSTVEGRPLLYVRQKALAMKEDIRFRLSPDDDAYLFMIKSKSVFEFSGRHAVLDPQGNSIGFLEKSFERSLFRSHWRVRDSSGAEVLESEESRLSVALLRRFAWLLPEWLEGAAYVPFNFNLYRDGKRVARYNSVPLKMRDRYVLELGPDLAGVDRRLLVAFAVGLDALQDR